MPRAGAVGREHPRGEPRALAGAARVAGRVVVAAAREPAGPDRRPDGHARRAGPRPLHGFMLQLEPLPPNFWWELKSIRWLRLLRA